MDMQFCVYSGALLRGYGLTLAIPLDCAIIDHQAEWNDLSDLHSVFENDERFVLPSRRVDDNTLIIITYITIKRNISQAQAIHRCQVEIL